PGRLAAHTVEPPRIGFDCPTRRIPMTLRNQTAVRDAMGADPFSGTAYVFRLKRAERSKFLFWDGSGVVLATKRLEAGQFCWPKIEDGVVRLAAAQLAALLERLDWKRVHAARTVIAPALAG
ncbi:IS66 family insertion sequence element accessory protein TnpB, partial [Methylobacterium pseudosasicola]